MKGRAKGLIGSSRVSFSFFDLSCLCEFSSASSYSFPLLMHMHKGSSILFRSKGVKLQVPSSFPSLRLVQAFPLVTRFYLLPHLPQNLPYVIEEKMEESRKSLTSAIGKDLFSLEIKTPYKMPRIKIKWPNNDYINFNNR